MTYDGRDDTGPTTTKNGWSMAIRFWFMEKRIVPFSRDPLWEGFTKSDKQS
jgi:hypothetical protein